MKVPHPLHLRLGALAAFLFAAMLVLLAVLYHSQIVQGDEFRALSFASNAASEEVEASRGIVTDRNGKVLCSYRHRNRMVGSISYTPGEGTALPITVITHDAYRIGAQRSRQVMFLYSLLYPVELAAVWLFYRRKRAK